MKEFIREEYRRIIDLIPQTDPATPNYHCLLQSLEFFAGISDVVEELLYMLDDADGKIVKVDFHPPVVDLTGGCGEDCATCDNCSSNCTESATAGEDCATCDNCSSNSTESVTAGENADEAEASEPASAEVEEAPGPSEKEDSSSDEGDAEAVTYDLVTVRKALIDARKGGADIKAILKSVGASNLTDLPPDKYGAVMAKLKELS